MKIPPFYVPNQDEKGGGKEEQTWIETWVCLVWMRVIAQVYKGRPQQYDWQRNEFGKIIIVEEAVIEISIVIK